MYAFDISSQRPKPPEPTLNRKNTNYVCLQSTKKDVGAEMQKEFDRQNASMQSCLRLSPKIRLSLGKRKSSSYGIDAPLASCYFCLSFLDDCHQSIYSSCIWRLLSLPFSSFLSRISSIFSLEANSPQLLQMKFLLERSNLSSPPHSGQ